MAWHNIITVESIFGAKKRIDDLLADGTYASVNDLLHEVEFHGLDIASVAYVVDWAKAKYPYTTEKGEERK